MAFRTSPCATKRRSAAMWIEVSQPEAKKISPEQASKKEDIPILSLSHFAKTPWVCFGEVKLATTRLEALIIHNPTDSPQTVVLEKLSSENGFHIEKVFCSVEAGSQEVLDIRWSPTKCGNVRELVNFRVNGTYLKQAILLGTALAPKKVLKERKKKPLEVLHPTNQTFVKPASKPIDESLFTKKAVPNSNFLRKTSTVSKISQEAPRPTCSSAVNECPPPDFSPSTICADVSCDAAAAFDSPVASDYRTPELLRAYRNRPKKAVPSRRKSTYVRLTPEGQAKIISDDARSPRAPAKTFQSSNELSPTRIPIAIGRGSPPKLTQDTTNSSKGFQNIAESKFSVPGSSRSPPNRRKTYVTRSPTNVAFSNSLAVGLTCVTSNNVVKRFDGASSSVASSPIPNSTPSPIDRRQTYVARSPVAFNPNSDTFYPIIDRCQDNSFPNIPDTPTRRNTFIKQGPSQPDLPTVMSPVNLSWADQCEMLELEISKDLCAGSPYPTASSYDVPHLEGISRVNRVTLKPTPKKSKLPRKMSDFRSKPNQPSNLSSNGNVFCKNDPFSSSLFNRKPYSAFAEVDSQSDSSRLVSDCVIESRIREDSMQVSLNTENNDKPKTCSDGGLQRCHPSTYRQNRYSDIVEIDDNSETSCFALSDSLEVLSPASISERPISFHTIAGLPSDSTSSDSLESVSPAVQLEKPVTSRLVDKLPRVPPEPDGSQIVSPVLITTTTVSDSRVEFFGSSNEDVLSHNKPVNRDQELPLDLTKQTVTVANLVCQDEAVEIVLSGEMTHLSNSPLHLSHLNYDEFCLELPALSLAKSCLKIVGSQPHDDDDEIRRCSTEVKAQPQKESFESEACRELFPDATKERLCHNSKTFHVDAEATDCDMRRISSETYVKTPHSSPLNLPGLIQEPTMANGEADFFVSQDPELFKVPGKRKSDEFCKDGVQLAKRLKGQELPNTPRGQEKTLNKLKSNTMQSQCSSVTKSVPRVMPMRLKLIKPPTPQTALAHHPNPFAAKNAYYDERWAEKQMHGFTRWLNFVLAMPDEFVMGEEAIVEHMKSMDVREVTCPSREVLSLREYRAGCSVNRLRRKACSLYQSREIVLVVNRLEAEIEKGQLLIRKDRALHADVGIRKKLLETILGYNSLWLRVGLETVFGVLIPLRNNNDTDGLSNFVVNYLLNNADIAKEYAHAVVPYLFKPGYAQAIKKHALKKFLLLVYFLDQAKVARLLQYNPCLFQKTAPFKSSKELLLSFSKDYLHGEGNIIKHLGFIGYKVSVQQTYLDEYDFSVKNLSVDLRNGIRLVKVTELITHNWHLLNQVRLPSESRLQKLHNIGLVFTAHKSETGHLVKDIQPKDIVDGHREKTLYLLWQMLYNLQISKLLDEKQLLKETAFLENSLNLREGSSQGDCVDMALFLSSLKELYAEENLQLLLRWCNLVCAHYGVQVENFTVAFSDGRALCFLINHYFPLLLPLESIKLDTTQTYQAKSEASPNTSCSSEDSFNSAWTTPALAPDKYESLLQNERSNLNLVLQKVVELGGIPLLLKANAVCNTIPDEKIMISFISYLWNRLWNLAAEVRAARTIQLVWRRRSLELKKQQQLKVENRSAAILQRAFRKYCLKRRQLSAIVIQNAWLAYREKVKHHIAASKIQDWYRKRLHTRHDQILEEKIIRLQSAIRAYLVRSKIQKKLVEKKVKSAILIQASVRGFLCRKHYHALLGKIVFMQAACRGHVLRLRLKQELQSREKHRSSAISIQAAFRGFVVRKRYKKIMKVICSLQSMGRGLLVRRQVQLLLAEFRVKALAHYRAAVVIQRCFRALIQMRQKRCVSAVKIQTVYRGFVQYKAYTAKRSAALTIQEWYRTCLVARKMHTAYLQKKRAAVVIQACTRCWLCSKRYRAMKVAAVKIQAQYRAFHHQRGFRLAQSASLQIQTWFRSCLQKKKFSHTRSSVIKIQSWFRRCKHAQMERNLFLEYKTAVLKLQTWTRSFIVARRYKKIKMAAICIQTFYRRYVQRKKSQLLWSAIKVQAAVRGYCQRKAFLRQRQAAKIIQQHYRRFQLMKVTRKGFLCQRKGAITIQAQIRMCLKRREYTEKKKSAIVIQAVVRGYLVRKRYQKIQHNICKIQRWYRGIRKSRCERHSFLQVKWSALYIQSFFRMHLECKKYKAMKLSALRIQSVFRAYKLRKQYQRLRKSIIKLQALYRGHVQRMSLIKKRHAAVQIQRWYLLLQQGKRERELFLQQRQSVIAIQALVRKWLAAQKYLRVKVATVKIQSTVRRFLCKSRYRTICSATLKIQSFFRAHQQRQRFLKMQKSAVVIQHWYKSLVEAKRNRMDFVNQKTAAIRIQAWFRMCLSSVKFHQVRTSAIKLQFYYRCYRQRMQYESCRCAAIKIQRWYRNVFVTKRVRQFYLKQKVAAVLIQKWYRECIDVRHEQQLFIQRKTAVLVIQQWYRDCVVARHQHQLFLQQRLAACAIQQWYRDCVVARHQHQLFLQQRLAACAIQQWYKNHTTAKRQREIFLHQRNAARVIQLWYRNCVVSRRQQKSFMQYRSAAVAIQRWYRNCIVIRQQNLLLQQRVAVIILQRQYRNYIVSKNQQKWFLKQKAAATTIKQWYKNCALSRSQRTSFLQFRDAVMTIQGWYRNCVVSRNQRDLFLHQRKVTVSIQRWYRNCVVSRQQQRLYLMHRCAVITIQQWFRNYVVGRNHRMIFLKQKEAVLEIQRWYRNCILSRSERQNFLQYKVAATIIQKWYKVCVLSRKHRESFLEQRHAARAVQRWYRNCIIGRRQQKSYLQQRMATLAIQRWYRNGILGRRYRNSYLQQRIATLSIQRWYKDLIITRHQRHEFLKKRAAACVIQCWYNNCVASKMMRKLFLQRRWATLIIQRWFRNCLISRHQQKSFQRMRAAATAIQKCYRNYILAKHQKLTLLQQRQAVVTIQRWYRNCMQGHDQRQSFLNYRDAALIIQRWYRSCTLTKHQQQLFLKYKEAALTIQQWYRNCIVGRRQHEQFLQYRDAIVKVQIWVRKWLIVRKMHQNNKAATVIQSYFRAYRQRKLYTVMKFWTIKIQAVARARIQRRSFLEVRLAAILIQRWYRHCKFQKLLRVEFLRKHLAAIAIQAHMRRWLVQKRLKSTIDAAIFIQRMFRQYIQRNRLKQRHAAAVKIQAKFRGWQGQRCYRRMKRAAIRIQANYRSFAQQKKFQRLRSSTIKIQALYRGLILHRRFIDMRLAAIVIQRWFRFKRIRELLYLDYQWKLVAAVRIQAHIRGLLVRRQVHKMKIAAMVIQTVYRQYRALKHYELHCHNYAATVIQTFYRAYMQRKSYCRIRYAVILIQRWFRCCKVREIEKKAAITIQSYIRMFSTLKAYKKRRNSVFIIQNAYRAHLQRHSFMKLKLAAVTCQCRYRGRMQRLSYMRVKTAAKLIQKWYRYCRLQQVERQQSLADNAAAVSIQSYVRMWLCIKQYKALKKSAFIIQRAYRVHLEHQSYIKQKRATVIIQRWVRLLRTGHAEREEYLTLKYHIIKLQSYIRQWLVSKEYKQICFSVCLIQASIRAYLCRKSYLELKCAVLVIQRWFRLTCEGYKARHEFQQCRKATIRIQAYYRAHAQRQLFLRKRCSVIIIQSYYRTWSCQRDYQALRDVALVIQRWYRSVRDSRFLIQTSAAIQIQAWVRMYITRRQYLETRHAAYAVKGMLLQDQYKANTQLGDSCMVQSYTLPCVAFSVEQQCYLQLQESAAIIIQRWYRNIKYAYRVRRWYLITRGAILTIQAFYRGMKYRHDFVSCQRAAVTIQTAFRGWLVRQQHCDQREAAITIQQWWRTLKLSFILQYDYLVMRGAAILLQAWIRGTLMRRSYLIMRGACIFLQANWRGYLARREYGVYRGAVLFIQCEFRRKLLFRRDLVQYHVMRGAAITIQAYTRGYIVRKQTINGARALRFIQDEFNTDFQALNAITSNHFASLTIEQQASFHVMRGAAITIQAWVRGWLVRRYVKRLLMTTRCFSYYQLAYGHFNPQRLTSAGDNYPFQAMRHISSSKKMKDDVNDCDFVLVDKASKTAEYQRYDYVVKIQSFFRMWCARRRYREMRIAVLMLQLWYRRILAKRQLAVATQECCRWEAAKTIQHCWRQHKEVQLSKQLVYVQHTMAAIKIQNWWRAWQRKMLAAQLLQTQQRHTAAVKIQTQWVALQTRRQFRCLLNKRRKAATVIQVALRNFLDGKKIELRDKAARKIQSWFRRLLIRRSSILAQELAIQKARRAAYLEKFVFCLHYHLCVIRIQRAYRFYAAHPNRNARSAIRIQDHSWFEVVPFGKSLRRAGSTATTVANSLVTQAVWRGYKVRSESQDRRVSSARQRILDATQSATPDNTLWNRTITALDYLLHCRNLSTVLVAVNNLDVAVRLSSVCCRQLVDVGGVPVLYKLICGCNRSVPHTDLVSGIVSVLLSLAKYDETMPAVWQEKKAMDVIPEVMRNFREKNPQILTKCCSLLWLLAQDPNYCLSMNQNCKFVEMLRSMHYLTSRKVYLEEQRYWQLASQKGHILPVCKGTPSKNQRKNLCIQPDWILGKGHMREFQEPISALSVLLTSLNIAPKRS